MKTFRLLLFALLAAAPAGAETSDPVGAFRLRLRGGSDTVVSPPLLRPALVAGAIDVRSGNQLTLAVDVPALPSTGAYVLVLSGPLEGAGLPVTARSGRTLTVTAGAFDLGELRTESADGSGAGNVAAVVPYWTLDTLFPAGAGINVSTSASNRATEVLFFDDTIAGINLSAAATFFYFAGSGSKAAGWYKVGDTAAPKGGQRLNPGSYFIVRHKVATDTTLLVTGCVQLAGYRVPLWLRTADGAQDNFVCLPAATPVSLGNSGLVDSGAFQASPSAAARTDELLVFDNTLVAQNKSASAVYFYFAGSEAKPAGWYKVGDTSHPADTELLHPGEGFVVRKRQPGTVHADQWFGLPSYLE
ncbi:MAG TPA: TIGR02597 family protein [Opitutus sp.]|nr:TIGR02597 family protein [Opitutus sp.]